MNFFGKKGGKDKHSQAQPAAEFKFDLSTPDAFNEADLAKMSGVDTMTFDENDPALMAELAELGWEEDDAGGGGGVASVAAGHRPRPNAPTRGRGGEGQTSDEPRGGGASAAPAQHQGGNELLRSLGLSLNSIGDAELTEQDLEDPDLLKELGEVYGDGDSEEETTTAGQSFAAPNHTSHPGISERPSAILDPLQTPQPEQLTEQDLQDPELLKELGVVYGDVDSEEETTTAGEDGVLGGIKEHADDEALEPDRAEDVSPPKRASGAFAGTLPDETIEAMLEDDDLEQEAPAKPEPVQAAAPAPPLRRPPAAGAPRRSSGDEDSEIIELEEKAARLRRRAVDLNRAGDREGAFAAVRTEKALQQELHLLRTLKTTQQVASVSTEYIAAPTPSPAGAGSGGGSKPVSAEKLMAQVELLYQRARELKQDNRTAEAMNCLKRAKSLEADLLRDAVDKGLITPGEEVQFMGPNGRRPSFARQTSYRSARAGGKGGEEEGGAKASEGRKGAEGAGGRQAGGGVAGRTKEGRRPGSRTELPASVRASIQPKAFPAERDLFSDLEDALAGAIRIHQGKAKALAKKDRAAASKEVKRYKELQAKLDLAREMRVLPGARPPPWQWKVTKRSRIRVVEQIGKDQMELEILRVHGLRDKTGNKGSFSIKYDLGYSKDDKIGKGATQGYRCDGDTVEVGFKALSYVKRARSMQMACQNRRATFEILHRTSMFSREKLIGKCLVPLQPLLTQCELSASSPILADGRREAGGTIELALRLRKPIASDELIVTEEKELEIGEWPPVSSDPIPLLPNTPIMSTPASARAVVAAAPAAAASAASRMAAAFQGVKLTDTEKADPFAVETLDSNNVLEAEIEAIRAKAATGDIAAVTRKGALETKLMMLVSAVQSGELDLPAYCGILKERIVRDKVLALHLKGEKRSKEAVGVMRRIRAMEEELAGVPQDEQGEEEEEEDGAQGIGGSV